MISLVGVELGWQRGMRRLLGLWVRVTIKPDDAASAFAARPRPVCYVLERESRADLAVLDMACRRLHLPSPERAHFDLIGRSRLLGRRPLVRAPRHLQQLVASAVADPTFDVDLVPVAVFWGRAPHKESSLWRLLFTEDWVLAGRFRKILNVAFNGHNTLVYFGAPLRLRDVTDDGLTAQRSVRRILRTLRTVLRAQKTSTIGPDLSHRANLGRTDPEKPGSAASGKGGHEDQRGCGPPGQASSRAAHRAQTRARDCRQLFAALHYVHRLGAWSPVELAV